MVQPIELRYFLFSSYNHIGKRIIICRECAKKTHLRQNITLYILPQVHVFYEFRQDIMPLGWIISYPM